MRYPSKIVLLLASTLLITDCRTISLQSDEERRIARYKQLMATEEALVGTNFLPSELRMPGEYMKVFQAAYRAFLVDDDIPANKRRVENYRVKFHQDRKNYQVFFMAKRKPSEIGQLDGGSSELGRDVTYVVDKSTYQVVYRIFYK